MYLEDWVRFHIRTISDQHPRKREKIRRTLRSESEREKTQGEAWWIRRAKVSKSNTMQKNENRSRAIFRRKKKERCIDHSSERSKNNEVIKVSHVILRYCLFLLCSLTIDSSIINSTDVSIARKVLMWHFLLFIIAGIHDLPMNHVRSTCSWWKSSHHHWTAQSKPCELALKRCTAKWMKNGSTCLMVPKKREKSALVMQVVTWMCFTDA